MYQKFSLFLSFCLIGLARAESYQNIIISKSNLTYEQALEYCKLKSDESSDLSYSLMTEAQIKKYYKVLAGVSLGDSFDATHGGRTRLISTKPSGLLVDTTTNSHLMLSKYWVIGQSRTLDFYPIGSIWALPYVPKRSRALFVLRIDQNNEEGYMNDVVNVNSKELIAHALCLGSAKAQN